VGGEEGYRRKGRESRYWLIEGREESPAKERRGNSFRSGKAGERLIPDHAGSMNESMIAF